MTRLVQVFDPPRCCSSGTCGPKVDNRLVEFSAALDWLRAQGVRVERYNPSQQYDAFVGNVTVVNMINMQGAECLPLILLDGVVASYGSYPSREELAVLAGAQNEEEASA